MSLPSVTSESSPQEDLTQTFAENRYVELTAENWLSFVGQGLNRNLFNNLHAVIPGGYRRNFYEKRVNLGEMTEDQETKLYAAVDEAIKELDAQQLLTRESPLTRLGIVTRTPFEQLSPAQQEFFNQFIALYKKLREKGFSHWDLVG